MLLNKEKDFLKEFDVEIKTDVLTQKIIEYEKKYNKNSLDVYFDEGNFLQDQDITNWISLIKKFLTAKGNILMINTIYPIDKIEISGTNRGKLRNVLQLEKKIILVDENNPLINDLIGFSEMGKNFIYVFGKNKIEFNNNIFVQMVVCDNPIITIKQLSDYNLILE